MKKYSAAQWESMIKQCYASDLKIVDWCKQHDVSDNMFYSWKRRLNIPDKDKFLSSSDSTSKPEANEWLVLPSDTRPDNAQNHVTEVEPDSPITITIGRASIRVNPLFQSEHLLEVIKTLLSVC